MERGLTLDCAVRFASGASIEARISMADEPGRITALFGPSGSGKTTCLRLAAGLLAPDTGNVRANGTVWADASRRFCLPPQQRGIGFLFQSYALFPHLDVRRNLAYGLAKLSPNERGERVMEIARTLEITDLLDRYPSQISGGQAQRVALGRAMAPRPRWLLLDEPLSALDAPLRARLGRGLRDLLVRFGIPAVVVTHDRAELESIADHLVVLDGGRVLGAGPLRRLLDHPCTIACARALGFPNILPIEDLHGSGTDRTIIVAGTPLQVRPPSPPEKGIRWAAILSEEIRLQPSGEPHASNTLRARVASVTREGPLVRLECSHPFPLVVHTTPQGLDAIHPMPGNAVDLRIPIDAIRLLAG